MDKKPVQTVIPQRIVQIAKLILDARKNGYNAVVLQKRQFGWKAAQELAAYMHSN